MRFELALETDKLALFNAAKLREVVLNERADHSFELSFYLDAPEPAPTPTSPDAPAEADAALPIPAYVSVEVAS